MHQQRERYYPPRPPRRRPKVTTVIAVLVLVAVVVIIGYNSMFTIRKIDVQGNDFCTKEEVIAASGIKVGDSVFSVTSGKVAAGINQNRYLDFVGVWRNFFPCSVVITVKEHAPRAKMMWMGMLVLVGDDGSVLEQTSEIDRPVHVPEILGMTATQVRIGQPILYAVAGQGEAIDIILKELYLQGVPGYITEINVASPDNLLLITENGLQIELGNDDDLAKKIAIIREVMPKLQSMGFSGGGGVLNVSTGRAADYRPAK